MSKIKEKALEIIAKRQSKNDLLQDAEMKKRNEKLNEITKSFEKSINYKNKK